MAAHRKFSEAQRSQVAYVVACRLRLPSDAQLAQEIGSTIAGVRTLMAGVSVDTREAAYQQGWAARRAGRLFADNPYLDLPGAEVQLRFWVDGHVAAIIDERRSND